MRIKQSKTRGQKLMPAPLPQRRRSKRRASPDPRGRQTVVVPFRPGSRTAPDFAQWLSLLAIGAIAAALIVLIWTMTGRSIADQTRDIRAGVDQRTKSVAAVMAHDLQHEMLLIDQSLAIVQDAWKRDSDGVRLGEWRKQLLALTSVAEDIFVANERRVIIQGTLPASVGQGFGSGYLAYTNGSLEVFEPDGAKAAPGRTAGGSVAGAAFPARQFLMYVLRPLDKPAGWFVGASYRSEELTKLFASAALGPTGIVALVETRRGTLQAIAGQAARSTDTNIAQSDLVETVRRNESGVWTGVSPFDRTDRIIAYQRIPGREMSVLVGLDADAALAPVAGLATWARGIAAVGTATILAVAGLVAWSILAARAARRRERDRVRTELDLVNARRELDTARARVPLSEAEVGTLVSSTSDGVARLDRDLRLRQWNVRFAAFAAVPLDVTALGSPIEDLLRRQAEAGVFGRDTDVEEEVARRLTILSDGGQGAAPSAQTGPDGETLTMHARAVVDGGCVIVLAGPENARFAAMPALSAPRAEAEPETEAAEEGTEW